MEQTIWGILAAAEQRCGPEPALVEGTGSTVTRRSYAQLALRVRARAAAWRALGIGPGERVAVLDGNSADFLECYFAAAALGAILCPLIHRLAVAELAEILADAGARLVLAGDAFAETVAALRPRAPTVEHWLACTDVELAAAAGFAPAGVAPDDVAHLYYTSGTTGRPKGVMLTHRNVCTHAEWAVRELALDARDRWGHFAPLFHLADAWATFAVTIAGGVHVMVPRFDADDAVMQIVEHGITLTNLVPTMLKRIVESPRAHATELPRALR